MSGDVSIGRSMAVFDQYFQQYRILNEQLNRIPPFAVTLTGGFWYIAVVVETYGNLAPEMENLARFSLMTFCGFCNLMLILVAFRVRDVMDAYRERLRSYVGPDWPDTSSGSIPFLGPNSMLGIYCALISAGGALSIAGGWILFWTRTALPWWLGAGMTFLVFAALIIGSAVLAKVGQGSFGHLD